MRAVTGVTRLEVDSVEALDNCMAELLDALFVAAGDATADDVISAVLGATPDVTAGFPAAAARRHGLAGGSLLGVQLQRAPGAPGRQVQVLLHLAGPPTQGRTVLLRGATLT